MLVTFHSSTFPSTIQRKVAEGISNRRLPPRLLYESIGQTNRWLNYAKAWAPIHRRKEIETIYNDVYRSVLEESAESEFHYLSLGCGDGLKDASFLECSALYDRRPQVTLVDVSPHLILDAALRLNAWQSHLQVADIESQPTRSELCPVSSGQPLVISCLGMLPTIGHEILLPYLTSILNHEDRLVLSANLSASASEHDKATIVAQYDNPEARLWYSGALLELGLERSDFELECSVKSLKSNHGAYRIITHATILRDLELCVHGDRFPMKAGNRLEVFRSERWTPSALRLQLSDLGLEVIHDRESKDCQEGVYAIAKRRLSLF